MCVCLEILARGVVTGNTVSWRSLDHYYIIIATPMLHHCYTITTLFETPLPQYYNMWCDASTELGKAQSVGKLCSLVDSS